MIPAMTTITSTINTNPSTIAICTPHQIHWQSPPAPPTTLAGNEHPSKGCGCHGQTAPSLAHHPLLFPKPQCTRFPPHRSRTIAAHPQHSRHSATYLPAIRSLTKTRTPGSSAYPDRSEDQVEIDELESSESGSILPLPNKPGPERSSSNRGPGRRCNKYDSDIQAEIDEIENMEFELNLLLLNKPGPERSKSGPRRRSTNDWEVSALLDTLRA